MDVKITWLSALFAEHYFVVFSDVLVIRKSIEDDYIHQVSWQTCALINLELMWDRNGHENDIGK